MIYEKSFKALREETQICFFQIEELQSSIVIIKT